MLTARSLHCARVFFTFFCFFDQVRNFDEGKPAVRSSIGGARVTGKVKWFKSDKGFGFLTTDAGTDVFVHYSSISGRGYRTLTEGQKVTFVVVDEAKGKNAKVSSPALPALPCGFSAFLFQK